LDKHSPKIGNKKKIKDTITNNYMLKIAIKYIVMFMTALMAIFSIVIFGFDIFFSIKLAQKFFN